MPNEKISVAVALLSIERGGCEETTVDLVNSISICSFDVHLIMRSEFAPIIEKDLRPWVHLHRVNTPDQKRPSPLTKISLVMQIAAICWRHNIDILQAQQYSAQRFCLPAAKLAGCCSIYSEHAFKDGVKKWVKKHYVAMSDRIICVSDSLKSQLSSWGCPSDRAVVIENGVRDPLDQLRREDNSSETLFVGKKVIMTVGRLVMQKGFDVLIEGFALFKNNFSSSLLVIIGDGPEQANLKNLAKISSVEEDVLFLGSRKQQELWRLLRFADVAIFPSRNEGFGLAVVEAMMLEKPVCLTPLEVFKSLIDEGRNGFLMDSLSPEGVAGVLERVFENFESAVHTGKQARKAMLTRFPLRKMVLSYEDLYRNLLVK